MTRPAPRIHWIENLDLWQVRGLLVILTLTGCAAFLFVWHLTAWEMSLRDREAILQDRALYSVSQRDRSALAGEIACLTLSSGGVILGPDNDPFWIDVGYQLQRSCGASPLLDERGEPFTLIDGRPLPPSFKPEGR